MENILPSVLIIDDAELNLIVVEELVEINFPNTRITKANSGKTGIALANQHNPDVILLDINMPGMDGFEVCSVLKANDSTRDIPVVFLTAYKDKSNRIKALEVGANGFMTKPVDEAELVTQIKTMARLKAMNQNEKDEKRRLERLVAERTSALEKELDYRIKTEKSLRESELKFSVAFQNSPVMISIFSITNGQFIEINDAFQQTLGYSLSDLQNDSASGLKIWDNPDDYTELLKDLQNGNTIRSREVYLLNSNGQRIPSSASAALLKLEGKELAVLTIENISDRKQQQQIIADNEARLRTLSENLPGFFYQLQIFSKEDIRINYLSKGIERFGLNAGDVLEKPFLFFDLINPEDLGRLLKQNDDAKVVSQEWHEQFSITTPDGQTKWIEVHDVPRSENDGSFIYNGYAFDVTDRIKTEQELKEHLAEMERFHHLTVDRELSMIELKKEVNGLLEQIGRAAKYIIVK